MIDLHLSEGQRRLYDGTRRLARETLKAAATAVAAFALTEPEAGSDPAALTLRAEPDRDAGGYRLSGEKLWISNAPEADVYTVFARTDQGARASRGLTAFAVPGDASGLT